MKTKSLYACFLFFASPVALGSSTWPTLHNDNQRSGYTSEIVKGPYERKWYRDFHNEMVATRLEAIVAEDKCFVGTFAGNLYALNVDDGSSVWVYKTGGPVGTSASYRNGRIYAGSDDGILYCINASSGDEIWKYAAKAGIWAAPTVEGNAVYFGDRSGIFHAVDSVSGKGLWTYETGGMILTPASINKKGDRIVFGSEDMHVYCIDPDGRLIWKSRKLEGLSLRDHGPTIWKGLAIVRTNPADGFHEVMNRNGDLLKKIQKDIPLKDGEKVLLDKWNDYIVTPSAERRKAEQDGIIEYLKKNRHDQTFYALSLADGTEPWITPVFYTCGLHNPPTAPTFDPVTGDLYLFYRTAMTTYLRGIRRYSAIGKLDRLTGRITWSWPESETRNTWYDMPMIGDETQSLSLMGKWLVGTHQGILAALNTENLDLVPIWRGRDTYGGIFGPGALAGKFDEARRIAEEGYLTGMPNEWHGPDRSIVSICDERMFWVAGSQVVCIGGPIIKAGPDGGTKPPSPFKSEFTSIGGNVANAAVGKFDSEMPRKIIKSSQITPWLLRNSPEPEPVIKYENIRKKLDTTVRELVEDGPWAPLVVEMGISGEERYFWKTSETIQILSHSLPYLSSDVRKSTVDYLEKLIKDGAPMQMPVHSAEGKRREYYNLSPGMRAYAKKSPGYKACIEDVYCLWAFAYYSGNLDAIKPQLPTVHKVIDSFTSKSFRFIHVDDPDGNPDPAEHLNAQIAGMLAYGRLMVNHGRKTAERWLLMLVTERVHHEKADTAFIRSTKTASHSLHQARIPRYCSLVPEVSQMLSAFCQESFKENTLQLNRELPIWYHAFGERLIGGENYISPPHLSRGLFAAMADGNILSSDDLTQKLDQPWCKADLYYIEKLTSILRNSKE